MVSAVGYEVSGFLSRRAQYSSETLGYLGSSVLGIIGKWFYLSVKKKPQLEGGGGGWTGAFYDVEIRFY